MNFFGIIEVICDAVTYKEHGRRKTVTTTQEEGYDSTLGVKKFDDFIGFA